MRTPNKHGRPHTVREAGKITKSAGEPFWVPADSHAKHRSVSHDQHEGVRREVARRLKTESGKKTYARRAHLAETPNGFIKDVLGLRQFLLRGLDKVRTEWLWACTAFNIRKLMIAMEKLRADGSLEIV